MSLCKVNYTIPCSVILHIRYRLPAPGSIVVCATPEVPASSLMLIGILYVDPLSMLFVKNISEFPKVLSLQTTYTLLP